MPALTALLTTFSWQELRHQPWRNAAAVVAVTLGVAMAFAVHLINASALQEFSSAVRAAGGQSDLELRARAGGFDEALYERIAAHPAVALASPVLEVSTLGSALLSTATVAIRVVGVDALVVSAIAPTLMPRPDTSASERGPQGMALFAPDAVYLNAAASKALGASGGPPERINLWGGADPKPLRVAGSVAAAGAPLVVMDIGAAQEFFSRPGQLSRIDLRLKPGTDTEALIAALQLPPDVAAARPQDAGERVQGLSRAYRVNLTVLALVALFTGAFLVFSVLSLSVAKRAQQFALLGVLGLTARERLALVLAESALLGLVGSALGVALGAGLAALALRLLGGDLGGGYFAGVQPTLHWSTAAALAYGFLGLLAAVVGGWWPARAAQALLLALTLKGLDARSDRVAKPWIALFLIAASGLAALAPPVFGVPLAAYVSVALLLVGGIAALPWAVGLLTHHAAQALGRRPRAVLALLAVERARRVPHSAAAAVSAVVASLSLAVALTVMVASFRGSVTRWLDVVLPADLYARLVAAAAAGDTVYFTPAMVARMAAVPGVERLRTGRSVALPLDPARPNAALMARPLGATPESVQNVLPLVGPTQAAPPGSVPIYVSEAFADLYGTPLGHSGALFKLLPLSAIVDRRFVATNLGATYFVSGVWRDYARQHGTVAIDLATYQRLTGDLRINDVMFWLTPQAIADGSAVQSALRDAVTQEGGAGQALEFASAASLRATSLTIFDRSFAVTTWLQMVAIAMGLFGVAASFSAQVLARRKEFGLLAHLGLTRAQVLWVVAGEGAVWTLVGALAGLALGLGVSAVLVHVVNPQSFHWTMDLAVPWGRLAVLCWAVVAAGTITAWLAGRAAAGREAVLAVKEDW